MEDAMRVQKLMKSNVIMCRPEDSLNEAARLMWEHDCGCLPVCADDDGALHLIGVITDRDICMHAYFRGLPLTALRVDDTMSRSVRSCRPTDSLKKAERIMRDAHVRRVPVVDKTGRVVGLISLADLAHEAVRERSFKKRQITDDDVTDTLSTICAARPLAAA
jgi:CBS domain-containing protein